MFVDAITFTYLVVAMVVVVIITRRKDIDSLEVYLFAKVQMRNTFVAIVPSSSAFFQKDGSWTSHSLVRIQLYYPIQCRYHFTWWRTAIVANLSQNCTVPRWHRAHERTAYLSTCSFLHASTVRRHAFPTFDFRFRHTVALLRLHLWQISLSSNINRDAWFDAFLWWPILDFPPYRDIDTLLSEERRRKMIFQTWKFGSAVMDAANSPTLPSIKWPSVSKQNTPCRRLPSDAVSGTVSSG